MKDTTDGENGEGQKSHVEKIRSNYNTTDLGAIMGRFYEAVSWRNN